MTKKELIRRISERKSVSQREATTYINAVLSSISDALAEGEEVVIPDFGRFKMKTVPEHQCKHPATGKTIIIPEKQRVYFKPFSRILSYSIIN
ncbi:MAG: HU family DNA-binding protein [Bacteroidales bacterium]|nr:HU family DNA-binding protein [Bacteroidales bacterium]